jgi:hypothetical protein
VSVGMFLSGEAQAMPSRSRDGVAAAALRWTLPWLLALVVASTISGVVTSSLGSDRAFSMTSTVAVESRHEPIDWSFVQERDPHLNP